MMDRVKNNSLYSVGYLVVLIISIISFAEYALSMFSSDKNTTELYLLQLFVAFAASFSYTVARVGLLHIFSLLHITTLVFAFGGILVSPLSEEFNFRIAHSPLYMKFTEVTVQKAILLYTLYVCFTFLFYWGIIRYKKAIYQQYRVLSTDKRLFTIAKYTMLLTLPFAIYYGVMQFTIAGAEGGLTALYSAGGNEALGVPLYVRIPHMFFIISYYILIASGPQKKDFVRFSLVYFIPLIPILLMGERGDVIVPIMFALWYSKKYYDIKINYIKLALFGFAIITVAFVLTYTRLGDDVGDLSTAIIIVGFLGTSATSFKLLGYYITFKDQIMPHNYPFVFDSLIAGLTGASGQNLETLRVRASIGHHLVYTLNPNYYLSGASTGTSYIAECFEFGVFGIIIGTFVLAYFLYYFDYKLMRSRYMMVFMFTMFTLIVLSPRGSLFLGIYDIIKYSIVYFLLVSLYNIFHVHTKQSAN